MYFIFNLFIIIFINNDNTTIGAHSLVKVLIYFLLCSIGLVVSECWKIFFKWTSFQISINNLAFKLRKNSTQIFKSIVYRYINVKY